MILLRPERGRMVCQTYTDLNHTCVPSLPLCAGVPRTAADATPTPAVILVLDINQSVILKKKASTKWTIYYYSRLIFEKQLQKSTESL